MSGWHFGRDFDMWLYPPVRWWGPEYDLGFPEPIEAADIQGTLLINADDAIEQVRKLQDDNARLHDALQLMYDVLISGTVSPCQLCDMICTCENHPAPPRCKYADSADVAVDVLLDFMRDEMGVEVDDEHA